MVHNSLGGVLVRLGGRDRLEEAEKHFRDSLKSLQDVGDRRGVAMVHNSLGGVLVRLGGRDQLQEAEQHFRDSLKSLQDVGDRRGVAMVMNGFANLAEAKNDIEEACKYLEEVVSINEELGDKRFADSARKRLEELRRKLRN
jgi:tetratricopeptide (TPR) repeat protein